MQIKQKLTDTEFKEMVAYLKRYVVTEMEQWELWKFDTDFGRIYVDISMVATDSEEAYIDLNHLINQE